MLHEYAVDPEMVATWCDRKNGRYFRASFGLGTPRVISKYPNHWKKLVREAWRRSTKGNDSNRLEELFKVLTTATVVRSTASWNPGNGWLDNTTREHQRSPFRAILAPRDNRDSAAGASARIRPPVLDPAVLDERTPLWSAPTGMKVRRTAAAIAQAVGSMLRIATDIVFVDPYFAPHRRSYLPVLASCLRACHEQRATASSPRVLILTSGDTERHGTHQFFADECRQRLPRRLPAGQEVTIRRLSERPGGERLHNRYVLTEHGGVSFGAGLDERPDGNATDDLNLLDREPYRQRWRQYSGDSPAFGRPEDDVTVAGHSRGS